MSYSSHIRFNGLGLVSTTVKQLDRSTKYDHLFPQPDWQQTIVRRDGLVTDVVKDMKKVIFDYRNQTKEFAPFMRGKNIYETCRNIWNFWYRRCAYHEDQKGLEQLRTAGRTYWEGAGFNPYGDPNDFGVDCDDFAIAVSQTLLNLGIPNYLRIARYLGVEYFQHVYVVLKYAGKEIIIDCVMDAFDREKPTIEQQDFLIMDKHNLNGIDVAVLSGFGDTTPLLEVVTGSDFLNLKGFGATTDEQKELDTIYQHILKTRQLVAENPELVKEAENPKQYLQMLDYALQYWNTDKRDEALEILSSHENEANQVRGFSPGSDTSESEIEMHSLSGGGYHAIGKVGGERKFFTKIKEATKKVGQGIKTVAKDVVKYNPLTVAARAGLLLAFKTNLLQMAETLKWGYLTEAEAKAVGMDLGEWKKSSDSLEHTKKMFVDVLQGKPETLRNEILTGRAGKLDQITISGLGVVTEATTTAAATGFIAQVKAWIKNIDVKKMLKKVDLKKLAEKFKTSDVTPNPTDSKTTDNTTNDTTPTDQSTDKSTDKAPPPPSDDSSSSMLPVLVIGGLGVAMLLSSGKKKSAGYSGFGSTKTKRKKSHRKKSSNEIYDIPALTGINNVQEYSSPSYHSKKKSKKKGAHKKIKKMKLR